MIAECSVRRVGLQSAVRLYARLELSLRVQDLQSAVRRPAELELSLLGRDLVDNRLNLLCSTGWAHLLAHS